MAPKRLKNCHLQSVPLCVAACLPPAKHAQGPRPALTQYSGNCQVCVPRNSGLFTPTLVGAGACHHLAIDDPLQHVGAVDHSLDSAAMERLPLGQ